MTILAGILLFTGALGFCVNFAFADGINVALLPGWIVMGLLGGLLLPWNRARDLNYPVPPDRILIFDRPNFSFFYTVLIFFVVCSSLIVFIGLYSMNAAHPVMLIVIAAVAVAMWVFVTFGMCMEQGNTRMAAWFQFVGRIVLLGLIGCSLYQLVYSVIPILIGTAMVVRDHDIVAWAFWLPALSATWTYGIVLVLLVYVVRFEDIHASTTRVMRSWLSTRQWWPYTSQESSATTGR